MGGGEVFPVRRVKARQVGEGEGGAEAEDGGGLLPGGPRSRHRPRLRLRPQGESLPNGRAATTANHQEAEDGGRAGGAQGREVLGEEVEEQGGKATEAEPDRPEGGAP